jgi:hypothetical protein
MFGPPVGPGHVPAVEARAVVGGHGGVIIGPEDRHGFDPLDRKPGFEQ